MPEYRCYPLKQSGSIDGAGQVFACIDDASAIAKASATFAEQPFEVWEGARRVYTTPMRSS
jgi:hypothetical protein